MITKIIEELCDEYMTRFSFTEPQYINTGFCFDFAYDVVDRLEAFGEVARVRSTPGHGFVEYQGRYYDSECPEGVVDHEQLPIFKRLYEYETIRNLSHDSRELDPV